MKHNWAVIGGIVVVITSALFLPIISVTILTLPTTGRPEILGIHDGSLTVIIVIVLFLLTRLKWKWRGILWTILSVGGMTGLLKHAYKLHIPVLSDLDSAEELTYGIGLYISLLGYAIVIGGSVWEVIQQRKSPSTASEIRRDLAPPTSK